MEVALIIIGCFAGVAFVVVIAFIACAILFSVIEEIVRRHDDRAEDLVRRRVAHAVYNSAWWISEDRNACQAILSLSKVLEHNAGYSTGEKLREQFRADRLLSEKNGGEIVR